MRKQGLTSNASVEVKPELYPDLYEIYDAFIWLSASRQFNETGPQPISYADVATLLDERHVYSGDERYEWRRYIRVLDTKFIELIRQKMERDREKLMNKSKSGKGRSKT